MPRTNTNSRGDNSGLFTLMLPIFNRVQVLINIKTLNKFEKNQMKTVEFIAQRRKSLTQARTDGRSNVTHFQ